MDGSRCWVHDERFTAEGQDGGVHDEGVHDGGFTTEETEGFTTEGVYDRGSRNVYSGGELIPRIRPQRVPWGLTTKCPIREIRGQ